MSFVAVSNIVCFHNSKPDANFLIIFLFYLFYIKYYAILSAAAMLYRKRLIDANTHSHILCKAESRYKSVS